MPKRTNPFQEIVTLIQEALAPVGATVTPSAMVPSPTSGKLREIDVLVETPIGLYTLKIAVEAKDEGRKLDVTKIETIIGKYRGKGALPVNKIVVIARNGFTAEARVRAQDEEIDLLTLHEAKVCNWCHLVPKSLNLHFTPMPVGFELTPALPKSVLEFNWLQKAKFICLCHGYDYGTPQFRMHQCLYHYLLPNKMLVDKMHEVAVNGSSGKSELFFKISMANRVLRFDDTDYPVESVTIQFRYVHAQGAMNSSVYKIENENAGLTTVMHSEGIVAGHKISMLMPLGKPDSHGILKIKVPPPNTTHPNGSSWTLQNGQWVESPAPELRSKS